MLFRAAVKARREDSMVIRAISLNLREFLVELDDLLYEVCEELQLPPYRYRQAEERYQPVAEVLEAKGVPSQLSHRKSTRKARCV